MATPLRPPLAAALVAILMANLVVALRWHVILSAEAPSPEPGPLLKIVLVALFFNQVLPTGVGGDVVRAWRGRKLGIGSGAAIQSILRDRSCGYLVMVVVYAATLPTLLNILADLRQRGLVIAVLGAGLLGLAALFLFDRMPGPLLRFRLIAPIAELSREGRRLFTHPARCGAVLGLSGLTIGLTIVAFKLVADGVGSRLSFGTWIMIVPLVTLIQLLPISLAGWGVREVALVVAGVVRDSDRGGAGNVGAARSVFISCWLAGGLIRLADWDVTPPPTPKLPNWPGCKPAFPG